jgi:hypothetical protein
VSSTILAYFDVSAMPIPPIPLPIYITCASGAPLSMSMGIALTTVSLVYGTKLLLFFEFHPGDIHSDDPADLLAFLVIVCIVVRSNANKIPISSLFKMIVQDATCYFLVIFTSHVVLVMFLIFADVSVSSQSSVFSLQPAYVFIGWNEGIACPVSDPKLLFLRAFTGFLSAQ